jgi:hypothetical protein
VERSDPNGAESATSASSPAPGPACPDSILDRIRWFRERYAEYHSPSFNEASLRSNFLRAFFHDGLNWDVENDEGKGEAEREVLVEESVSVKGAVQRLDYLFRVGESTKFIVEAKKPSVNILDAREPALQLRNYGWNKKLSLCVLTNFETFSVYDVRIPPKPSDGPSVARISHYSYEDYPSKWQEIWGTFSRDGVLNGRLDNAAAKLPATGREEVDASFLRQIESWRDELATHLKLRNPSLTGPELNFAVQAIIDRVIFLRIGEDRGLEAPHRLLSALSNQGVFQRLNELFVKADQRYNSGLFHFEKEAGRASAADTLTPGLHVDDEVLRRIITRLYPPDSPYDFRVLPVEVLGQVYERFLGKVIQVTAKRARVELKPEVRKAGGVFYTPSYIVDRIVKRTIQPLVEGQSPERVASLRILDPACGSGSFLLGAYQFLLNWHLDQYAKEPKRWRGRITQVGSATFALTTQERRRILLANIYGVDIDPQAVEVTKLSLLLRVLEKTQGEAIDRQLKLSHERALPDLDTNIRCGNSLLNFRQVGRILLDDETRRRVNPFDWTDEFVDVFAEGGFDAVIGNPPYVPIQTLKEWAPLEVELLKQSYLAAQGGNFDIYGCFIERALSPELPPPLLRPGGRLGFIVPHKFFNSKYGAPLRTLITSGRHLAGVVHFGDQQVFEGATTYTCLLSLTESASPEFTFQKVENLDRWRLKGEGDSATLPADKLGAAEWNLTLGRGVTLREKLDAIRPRLGEITNLFVGLQTSDDPIYVFKDSVRGKGKLTSVRPKLSQGEVELETELLRPVIRRVGGIGRFWGHPTAVVLFPYRKVDGRYELIPEPILRSRFPKTWAYLLQFRSRLARREGGRFSGPDWYRIYPKNLDAWEQPKVLLPYMIERLTAYYDEGDSFFVNVTTGGFGLTVNDPRVSLRYLTGLLNSKLLDWYLKQVSTNFQGGYFAANKQFIEKLPVRLVTEAGGPQAQARDVIIELVDAIQRLNLELRGSRTDPERVRLSRQISAAEAQIDNATYVLYGLTADEIDLVESQKIPPPKGRKRGRRNLDGPH